MFGKKKRFHLDFFPIRHSLKGYSLDSFKCDARAAVSVSLMDFPQAMSCAMIAGLPLQWGLFCSILASITGPLFASSRFVMLGTTMPTTILLLSTLLGLGITGDEALIAIPVVLTLVGVFMFLGALFRIADIIGYVSRSVMIGYIMSAAVLIISNQLSNVFGYNIPPAASFVEVIAYDIEFRTFANVEAFLLSVCTAIVYLIFKRFAKGFPNVALTLIVMGGVSFTANKLGLTNVPYLTAITIDSWDFAWPSLHFQDFKTYAQPALIIAFLVLLESSTIAKTLAAQAGDRLRPNQHMLSLGIANMVNAVGSGMLVSGSLTRSSLNFAEGAKTGVASILSGIFLLGGVFALGSFVSYIPRCSLATLIIFVGITLIKPRQVLAVTRATRFDSIVFWLTFFGGLIFDLKSAIYIGIVTSIVLFLRKASLPQLVEFAFTEEGDLAEKGERTKAGPPEISIVHVEGNLFFGSTEIFLEQMRQIVGDPNLKVIILRMRNAQNIDATSAIAISDLARFARDKERTLIVSGVVLEVEKVFRDSGLISVIGEENVFPYITENPNESTRNALKRAQEVLGQEEATIKLFVNKTEDAVPASDGV